LRTVLGAAASVSFGLAATLRGAGLWRAGDDESLGDFAMAHFL
jgi:hypothetical protein